MPLKKRLFAPSEDAEQAVVAQWLNLRGLLWTHPPNGGLRDIRTAVRLKKMGTRAGVPDILVFDPPPMAPQAEGESVLPRYVGVALELKATGAHRTSPQQTMWLEGLRRCGWMAEVCVGAKAAISLLTQLGYATLRRTPAVAKTLKGRARRATGAASATPVAPRRPRRTPSRPTTTG